MISTKKLTLYSTLLLICGLFLFFQVSVAQADNIKVKWEDKPLFKVKNAYPGYSKTKEFKITNTGTEDQDLYLNLDVTKNSKLAKKIHFYLTDKSSGKYLIGGSGDRYNLKKLDDEGDVYVERLKAGESNRYKMKLKLDKLAGNEYQDQKNKFDLTVGFVGKSTTTLTGATIPSPIRLGQGAPEILGEQNEGVNGASNKNVAGEENQCQSWPKWIWVLALTIFAGVFATEAWKNYKKEEYGWKTALLWTIIAIAFWYFFDICREFIWFLYLAIIFAIIIHFAYLFFLKQKIKNEKGPEIKEIPKE